MPGRFTVCVPGPQMRRKSQNDLMIKSELESMCLNFMLMSFMIQSLRLPPSLPTAPNTYIIIVDNNCSYHSVNAYLICAWCSTYIISLNPERYLYPVRYVLLSSSFYRNGNQTIGRSSNLPTVKQLVSCRSWIWNQIFLSPESGLLISMLQTSPQYSQETGAPCEPLVEMEIISVKNLWTPIDILFLI